MPCVLLVEDELLFRRILTMNLVHRGYTVIEADSVATAKESLLAFSCQFDLLLLDINLPDQTGWDVLRYLQAMRCAALEQGNVLPDPPVIIITAVRPAPSRLAAFPPKAVLVKPFPIEVLLRLMERILAPVLHKQAEAVQHEDVPDHV
jgi:CheY-like chemotaxis protein